MITEPRLMMKPSFFVVGMRNGYHFGEIERDPAFINKLAASFFDDHADRIQDVRRPLTYVGVIEDPPPGSDFYHYTTGLEVRRMGTIPQGLIATTIPANKYAVFTYVGRHEPRAITLDTIRKIYDVIFGTWLPRTPHRLIRDYRLETINLAIATDDFCRMELCLPVA